VQIIHEPSRQQRKVEGWLRNARSIILQDGRTGSGTSSTNVMYVIAKSGKVVTIPSIRIPFLISLAGEYEYQYGEPAELSYSHEGMSEITQGLKATSLDSAPWTQEDLPADPHDIIYSSMAEDIPRDFSGPAVNEEYQHYSQQYVKSSDANFGDSKVTCSLCSRAFPRSADLDRHYKTVHLNEGARRYQCTVEDCPADVRSWTTAAKLRLHEKTWHGGDSDADKSHTQQPVQVSSEPDIEAYDAERGQSPPAQSYVPPAVPYKETRRYIRTKDSKIDFEALDRSKSCNHM
jgi:hypothetical protein